MAALLMSVATGIAWAEEANPVLGKVGDFVLREADLDRIIAAQSPEVQKRIQDDPQLRGNLVREILMKKAVVIKARKEGFDRKPEVKEQLSYVFDNFISQEYLVKVVTAGVTVPEEDLKKFYQEHEKEFLEPEQIKVRHILIASTKDAGPEEKQKARGRAEAALLRLKKGEDFAALAKELSEDQNSAQSGGELAVITLGKTNSEEFEKAAFALKPGEISEIVATAYGFHIIRLDQRQEKRPVPFADARDFIFNRLKAEQEQKKVLEFMEKAVKETGLEVAADKSAPAQESGGKTSDSGKKDDVKK
jgi:parvulin-like peptidyl-prolyl isomerase